MTTCALVVKTPSTDLCEGISFLDGIQEIVVLTSAFVLGWLLIRPALDLLRRCIQRQAPLTSTDAARPSSFQDVSPDDELKLDEVEESSDEEKFQRPESRTRPPSLTSRVRLFGRQQRPDLAVDLWISVADATPFGDDEELPESEVYASALQVCVECRDFDSALRLVARAGYRAPFSSHISFQALARWLSRRQDYVRACQCITAIRSGSGDVDLQTMRCLIVTTARSGNLKQALAYLDQMTLTGLRPDFASYSAIVRCSCNVGEIREAIQHLKTMLEQGLLPDVSLFDTMIKTCASQNSLRQAEEVLELMREADLKPSNCILASIITLYSLRGELQRALRLFEDMPSQYDLEPNAHVHGSLIDACCNHDRADLAMKAFESMATLGCFPGSRTYERLIQSCMKNGLLEKAFELVDTAMCLETRDASDVSMHRTFLEPKVVEALLTLTARRRQVTRLALPSLQRLSAVGFELPDSLVESLLRAAANERQAPQGSVTSKRQERSSAMQSWRNFA